LLWWQETKSRTGRLPSTAQPCCLWNGHCSLAIGRHILFFFIQSSFHFIIHYSAYLKIVSDLGAVWKNANHPKQNKTTISTISNNIFAYLSISYQHESVCPNEFFSFNQNDQVVRGRTFQEIYRSGFAYGNCNVVMRISDNCKNQIFIFSRNLAYD
jgi:hypothetical protein